MTLGERIKSARKEKGLSQSELGDLVGVGKSSVCQWESGLTKNLDGINLVQTALVLGLNPVWLATEKGHRSIFQSNDPIHEGVFSLMLVIKEAIDESDLELSQDAIKQIYKRVLDYFFDGFDLNLSMIKTIIDLQKSK